ncbi:hypothetical protein Kisp02_22640 [Kineosporia sp. NBRC 101731]|nr:hypothetical protein Kisp02_22640 [Kineosporia sp. NBRC 101731]
MIVVRTDGEPARRTRNGSKDIRHAAQAYKRSLQKGFSIRTVVFTGRLTYRLAPDTDQHPSPSFAFAVSCKL